MYGLISRWSQSACDFKLRKPTCTVGPHAELSALMMCNSSSPVCCAWTTDIALPSVNLSLSVAVPCKSSGTQICSHRLDAHCASVSPHREHKRSVSPVESLRLERLKGS